MSSTEPEKATVVKNFDLSSYLIKIGIFLISLAVIFYVVAFYPTILMEIKYLLFRPNADEKVIIGNQSSSYITPADKEFGLVIPKIGANAKVIANVNPFNPIIYQQELAKGVAHAQGTVFPGQIGNTFIFSHSSVDFFEARKYNSIFYLLNKMEKNDYFYLIYKSEIYKYKVVQTKIVEANEIEYLKGDPNKKQATLMTCWPAGTNLKRLLVIGDLVDSL